MGFFLHSNKRSGVRICAKYFDTEEALAIGGLDSISKSSGKYISTMFFQIELPRDSMIVGRNRGHVTSRAKRVKYKAEVEAILSLSRGVIHLKEHS